MVRIVIDANVLVSAAFGGTPLDAVGKAFSVGEVYLSPVIVDEIGGTIERLSPKLADEKIRILSVLWKRFQSLCRVAEPELEVSICRDPKDDAYLSLCVSVGARFLITGDKDLLSVALARVTALPRDLKILTPREFMETNVGET